MLKFILFSIIALPMGLSAQVNFIEEGKILYQRTINNHRQLDDVDFFSESYKDLVKKIPTFHTSEFSLQFNARQSIYKLSGVMPQFTADWLLGPSKENVVYNNFEQHSRTSSKKVYESTFIINDSIYPLRWRVSDEKRTIAGFECSKAVTIICDSVYVVAFYTDEIPVSGGPESFGGLPGMILGIAIPRLHTTWFATKVELIAPAAKDFIIPTKGQRINNKKLADNLNSSLKSWGKRGDRNIWWTIL